jgi:2-polyprenyl-3-methyl-5-hydroxy-6-metoxy-1,4-benzoquinol methylase
LHPFSSNCAYAQVKKPRFFQRPHPRAPPSLWFGRVKQRPSEEKTMETTPTRPAQATPDQAKASPAPSLDEQKLMEFVFKVVGEVGAAMSSNLVLIGDKLGLYRALAQHGPLTSTELAKLTGTAERYVREWLGNQAAGGYVTYDPSQKSFRLPPEHAFCLANEDSPVNLQGAFAVLEAMQHGQERILENFRTGQGLEWGKQHTCLFTGTERFFRAAYVGHLINDWLPALDGVKAKLEQGATVADVGCGLGASTILMAQAFPRSKFIGYDYHEASIRTARERAKAAGVADRVDFQVARATDFPGQNYDLVCTFDCLHDMEDPAGAARHIRKTLAPTGRWMIVEPLAGDKLEDNLNPVSRVYYAASTMVCVPHSLSGHGPALGAQAGEARLREIIVGEGGFSALRRATQTPFNLVLEARAE